MQNNRDLGDLQVIGGWTLLGSSKCQLLVCSRGCVMCPITFTLTTISNFDGFMSTLVSHFVWVDADEFPLCKYFNCGRQIYNTQQLRINCLILDQDIASGGWVSGPSKMECLLCSLLLIIFLGSCAFFFCAIT